MAKKAEDRDPLLGVASSISDLTEIDWKDLEREITDEETTAVVTQLQIVEQIARLHAAVPGDSTPLSSRASAVGAAWLPRHLERMRAWASRRVRHRGPR